MKPDQVLVVLNLLYDDGIDAEYCSPNFVADFSYNRDIELTSDEVVIISDYYGEEHCPTGRGFEAVSGE
jgi:hypothetical protein